MPESLNAEQFAAIMKELSKEEEEKDTSVLTTVNKAAASVVLPTLVIAGVSVTVASLVYIFSDRH